MKLSILSILSLLMLTTYGVASAGTVLKCDGQDPVYGPLTITFEPEAKKMSVRDPDESVNYPISTFSLSPPTANDPAGLTLVSQPFQMRGLGLIVIGMTYSGDIPEKITADYIDPKTRTVKATVEYECTKY